MKDISEATHIIKIGTICKPTGCEFCQREFLDVHDIDYVANHYIKEHGYKIAHIGQDSSWNRDVSPSQQWNESVIMIVK